MNNLSNLRDLLQHVQIAAEDLYDDLRDDLREELRDLRVEIEDLVQGPAWLAAPAVIALAFLLGGKLPSLPRTHTLNSAKRLAQQAEQVGLDLAGQSAHRAPRRICMLSR